MMRLFSYLNTYLSALVSVCFRLRTKTCTDTEIIIHKWYCVLTN